MRRVCAHSQPLAHRLSSDPYRCAWGWGQEVGGSPCGAQTWTRGVLPAQGNPSPIQACLPFATKALCPWERDMHKGACVVSEERLKIKTIYLWGRDGKQSWPRIPYQYLGGLLPLGEGWELQYEGYQVQQVKLELNLNFTKTIKKILCKYVTSQWQTAVACSLALTIFVMGNGRMLCCPGLAAVSDGSCVPGTPGLGFPSSHGVKLFCISLAAQVWVGLSGKKKN